MIFAPANCCHGVRFIQAGYWTTISWSRKCARRCWTSWPRPRSRTTLSWYCTRTEGSTSLWITPTDLTSFLCSSNWRSRYSWVSLFDHRVIHSSGWSVIMTTAVRWLFDANAFQMCNLFEHSSTSEWLLYISEWQLGSGSVSNIRVTTKVAVNSLLSEDKVLQDRGTALVHNLACKEVKTVVCIDSIYFFFFLFVPIHKVGENECTDNIRCDIIWYKQ